MAVSKSTAGIGGITAKCVNRRLAQYELQNDVENLQGKLQKCRVLNVVVIIGDAISEDFTRTPWL